MPEVESQAFSLPPAVFNQLNRLRFHTGRRLRGAGAGQRPSSRRRPAAEFREHRKYVPGDDIRFVDWKASARSEQVFLKQGEQPQENAVHLLLDSSASMTWGEPPRRIAALQLAAALGYLALNGDDRFQLLPVFRSGDAAASERVHLKGKGQYPLLWNTLQRMSFSGVSDLHTTVRFLASGSAGGLVLILSDLLDTGLLEPALALLPRPAWQVAVLHLLHPREIAPEALGEVELVDAETGRQVNYDIDEAALAQYRDHFHAWRDGLERSCVRQNAQYKWISTGWSLEREILPQLHRAGLLEPA